MVYYTSAFPEVFHPSQTSPVRESSMLCVPIRSFIRRWSSVNLVRKPAPTGEPRASALGPICEML